jgi:hypothetical protein
MLGNYWLLKNVSSPRSGVSWLVIRRTAIRGSSSPQYNHCTDCAKQGRTWRYVLVTKNRSSHSVRVWILNECERDGMSETLSVRLRVWKPAVNLLLWRNTVLASIFLFSHSTPTPADTRWEPRQSSYRRKNVVSTIPRLNMQFKCQYTRCCKDIYIYSYILAELAGVARDSIRNEGTQIWDYIKIIIICKGLYPPRNSPRYLLDRSLGGPQNRSPRSG